MVNPQELPEQFGRYRILTRLGQGGMGAVYLAHDGQLDRRVALKVPHPALADDPIVAERFRREAHLAARLSHPNLCPVHDVGCFDGLEYFTMAYVEGLPLSRVLAQVGRLKPRDAAELLRQIALAVELLHAQGIVHRDLKPANIMVRPTGEPVLMDFGLAVSQQTQARLTTQGTPVGTPIYMSPEQVRGDPSRIGAPTDVYSLGVILYELVTGRPPFNGQVLEVFAQILHAAPPAPSVLRPDLGLAVDALCVRAMARDPRRRFASALALAQALEDFRNGTPRQDTDIAGPVAAEVNVTHTSEAAPTLIRQQAEGPKAEVVHGRCPTCRQTLLLVADTPGHEVPCPRCRQYANTARVNVKLVPPPRPPRRLRVGVALVGLLILLPLVLLWALRDRKEVEPPQPSRAFTNSLGMKLVRLQPGSFVHGQSGRRLTMPRAFWLATCEVTKGQFREFVTATNFRTENENGGGSQTNWKNDSITPLEDQPVVFICHGDAQAFCAWLSKKEQRPYALPTEVEWEYACRAGATTLFSFGDYEKDFKDYGRARTKSVSKPDRVASYRPNAWGLYDMHGNVWEWCQEPIVRGGSFLDDIVECCCESWYEPPEKGTYSNIGFRVLLRTDAEQP